MAVHVEDHPLEYFDFEGVIPARQYGAGDVIVWDWGTWEPEAETPDPTAAIANGELKFRADGRKLSGRFTIVRTSRRPGTAWSRYAIPALELRPKSCPTFLRPSEKGTKAPETPFRAWGWG